MARPLGLLVLLVLLVLAAPARAADEPGDLRRLFTHQADVLVAPPGGLVRLELPPAVLAECRPDLSDLRLLDPSGRETPFLVDTGVTARTRSFVLETVEGKLLDARQEELKRETGPPLRRETYRIEAPARAAEDGAWQLVLEVARPEFVRRIDVVLTRPDGSETRLVESGSVFRLRNPLREKTRLILPGALAGQLTLTLEGEDGAYLEPAFRFESNRALEPLGQIVVPLVEIGRRQDAGRTVVELERPGGVVPDVLRVETRTGSFERPIAVWDEGPAGRATQVGSGTLRRLEGAWKRHGGERWLEGGPDTDQHEVELRPARGERLRVEITDADSPPLDALGFAAVVRQPTLFFSAAAPAGDTPAATLYFGGGRVQAPHYDLAGLAPLLRGDVAGERVPEAVRLRDLSRIDKAELRDVRPNPALATTPVLAYAMRPGAELDTRLYSHRRAFTVRPSTAGLARLRLEPEDLAETRPDLADVRVVDAAGRQWPYLLERDTAETWESLGVTPPERRRGRSRHTLRLRLAPLRLDRLALEVDTRFFDRPFRLVAPDAGDTERTIAQGRLARGADGKSLVTVAFPAARVDALVLVVEDGDDAPLVLRSARVRLPLPELYLAAPAGQYALLVGNPDATAPSYDLARVRDTMLAVKSVPAVASESVPNPAYSARARATSGEGSQKLLPQVALWVVLIGAVAVLTAITLRLARRGEDAGS